MVGLTRIHEGLPRLPLCSISNRQVGIIVKTMISYEEYNKKKDDEAEDVEELSTTTVVIITVLSSMVGILIAYEAIFVL